MLERVELPSSLDKLPIPRETESWIADAQRRIEAFQDCWEKSHIEQFVAADYALVYQTLAWLRQTQSLIGNRIIEWGCGFAVVSALASQLGWDVIGVEAEQVLLDQADKTIASWRTSVQLINGNFLPPGAETLSDDPTLPSLGHDAPNAYELLDMDLDDFAIVYAYPWPGEDDFHEAVFDRYAAPGALLVLFCGPHDMRVWRKRS